MLRQVDGIEYTLTRKRVKNINLRVRDDLTVAVSASSKVPVSAVDAFVASKKPWIESVQARILQSRESLDGASAYSEDECMALFSQISDRFYPMFADVLDTKPILKIRLMKTRWGVCNTRKRSITLNKSLYGKPIEAIEYVILHEYVHFLHPNHQAEFHATMQRLMPDYRQRKKLL